MKMPPPVGPPGESFAPAVAQPLAPVAYAHRPQQTRRDAPRSRCGACGHSGGTGEGGGRGAISIQPAGRGWGEDLLGDIGRCWKLLGDREWLV